MTEAWCASDAALAPLQTSGKRRRSVENECDDHDETMMDDEWTDAPVVDGTRVQSIVGTPAREAYPVNAEGSVRAGKPLLAPQPAAAVNYDLGSLSCTPTTMSVLLQ